MRCLCRRATVRSSGGGGWTSLQTAGHGCRASLISVRANRGIHDFAHIPQCCSGDAACARLRRRQPARAGAGQHPVHSHRRLSRRPVRLGRLGLLQRHGRLLHHDQRARRRRERGQAHLGRVRNRVQQRARRRVLRAAEEEGPDRRHPGAAHVHRHHLFDPRPLGCRQDTAGHHRLRPHRHQRRPRVSLRLSDDHQLLEPDHGDHQVHGPEAGRHGQAEGQENRARVSRFGLRQGADPGAGGPGEEIRLRAAAGAGAAAGRGPAGAMAARAPGQAGLRAALGGRRHGARPRSRPPPRSAIRATR